jgi:hypothetical protein
MLQNPEEKENLVKKEGNLNEESLNEESHAERENVRVKEDVKKNVYF